MKITEAIEKARQDGFNTEPFTDGLKGELVNKAIFLEPGFWQALGAVEGWEQTNDEWLKAKAELPRDFIGVVHGIYPEWHFHMHRLIDHLASGGSIESFFESL